MASLLGLGGSAAGAGSAAAGSAGLGAAAAGATGGFGGFMQNVMNSEGVKNAEQVMDVNNKLTGGGIGSLGSGFQKYAPQLGPSTFMDLITKAQQQQQMQQPNQGQVQNGQYQF